MSQAFGADLSGIGFDFKEYIKTPSVIVRLISLLFSIIVFSCIADGGYFEKICLYYSDVNACNYGIGIGVLAFLACIGFLIGDALFVQLSNVDHRKYYVIIDIAFSGLWSFLWFVGFCYLTNRLSRSGATIASLHDVRAAVAFSFFSIFTWGIQCFFAVRKYQSGVGGLFATSDDVIDQQSSYSGNIPDPVGSNRTQGGPYNDDQMIGGDLSGGYQQQHY